MCKMNKKDKNNETIVEMFARHKERRRQRIEFVKKLFLFAVLPVVFLIGIYLLVNNGCIIVRNTVISYVGFSKHVKIPKTTFFRIPVESIADSAFYGNKRIKSVVIPEYVRTIGDSAFAECENLEKVDFRSDSLSLGDCVFRSCINLKAIDLPKHITSIGWGAFNCCESLETIEIPSEGFANNIPTIAFAGCTNLKSVTMGDNIKYIGVKVFWGCENLEYITVSPKTMIDDSAFMLVGNKVKEINYINSTVNEDFYVVNGCIVKYRGNSENVIIPEQINGVKITDIASLAFYVCNDLKELTIPGSIKIIHSTFTSNCKNLTTIRFSDGVERISDAAFSRSNPNLKKIIIPKNAVIYDHNNQPLDKLRSGWEIIRK